MLSVVCVHLYTLSIAHRLTYIILFFTVKPTLFGECLSVAPDLTTWLELGPQWNTLERCLCACEVRSARRDQQRAALHVEAVLILRCVQLLGSHRRGAVELWHSKPFSFVSQRCNYNLINNVHLIYINYVQINNVNINNTISICRRTVSTTVIGLCFQYHNIAPGAFLLYLGMYMKYYI